MSDLRATDCPYDVVVVAASLGGVPALATLLGALPTDFPASVLVVQHRSPHPDLLAAVLRRSSALPVVDSRPGPLRPSTVHVLPPRGGHVLAAGPVLSEADGGGGPADEVMLSAAQILGGRSCAMVLTGRGADAARGVRAIKAAGGMVLAQAPAEARAPEMPTATIATGCVDLVLPLRVLGPALVSLAMAPGAARMFSMPPRPWAELAVS